MVSAAISQREPKAAGLFGPWGAADHQRRRLATTHGVLHHPTDEGPDVDLCPWGLPDGNPQAGAMIKVLLRTNAQRYPVVFPAAPVSRVRIGQPSSIRSTVTSSARLCRSVYRERLEVASQDDKRVIACTLFAGQYAGIT